MSVEIVDLPLGPCHYFYSNLEIPQDSSKKALSTFSYIRLPE